MSENQTPKTDEARGAVASSDGLAALYYDVATWEQILREVPYPFKRKYAIGQSFVDDSKTWVVVNAWTERNVYYVLCSRSIPAWLADNLRAANARGELPNDKPETPNRVGSMRYVV